jgi:hypothetical protein
MRIGSAICGLIGLSFLSACSHVLQHGPIISAYESATCVPPHQLGAVNFPDREWDNSITDSHGEAVRVLGAQMPGGRIEVRYGSDEGAVIAANAGDYIYPDDVRVDKTKQKIFVKASGITAALSAPQTWLFEFDLIQRKQSEFARVDPTVLPTQCPIE